MPCVAVGKVKRLWSKRAKAHAARPASGSVVASAPRAERSAAPDAAPQRVLTEGSFKIPRAADARSLAASSRSAADGARPLTAAKAHPLTASANSAASIATRRQSLESNRPSLTFKRPSDAFRMLRGPVRPTRSDLINAESALGSLIFGPIPEGHRREFFHDKENIWIWHEEWVDAELHERQLTVRYEVRPTGVFKKVAAGKYYRLEGEELANFRKATHAYLKIIKEKLYRLPEVKA